MQNPTTKPRKETPSVSQTIENKSLSGNNTKPVRKDLYQTVTDTIIQQLEAGVAPWIRPYHSDNPVNLSMPENITTGKGYRGINILLLWSANLSKQYTSNEWATFKQLNTKGEQIRKGEKGSMIVYYDTMEIEKDGAIEKIPFLKSSIVFNKNQLLSYQPKETIIAEQKPLFERVEHIDQYVQNTKVAIDFDGRIPCYDMTADTIHMPLDAAFLATESSTAKERFYGVLLHELVHSTGHPTRLDRKLKNRFGSPLYAQEELVAELGAAFLSSSLQITQYPKPDHASYIASWLQALKQDKKAILVAASAASKAVDYLNSLQPTTEPTPA